MRLLYLFSVWLHLLAAIAWVGGIVFLVLVVVPWLRRGGDGGAVAFLRESGSRFRRLAWACFAIVLVTGVANLWMRGVRPRDLVDPGWLGSPFGTAAVIKLAVFAFVLVLSAMHDFVIGPRATAAMAADPRGAEATRLRRRASQLGRVTGLLALLLVALGVILVRGWP